MVTTFTDPRLTTPATSIPRVKYWPLEVYCCNCLPNTNYDAYANNVNINAFCKPYGGKLGQQLQANSSGRLLFQYMMAIPYNQNYVVQPSVNAASAMVSSVMNISLVDPFGNQSTVAIPMALKSGTNQ